MIEIIPKSDKSIQSQSERGRKERLYPIGFALVALIALSASLPGGTPLRLTPDEYFHQPRYSTSLEIIDNLETIVSRIVEERALQIWGENASKYFEDSGLRPYSGLYQSDSVFIQRRVVWVSSLFARDIDFVEVSLYTTDGVHALRETYAINRDNESWRVIDSAGFPFFERTLEITSETIASDSEFRDFILTTLSYAGYGSYTVLDNVDTIYHRIDLSESIGEKFLPLRSQPLGDTIEIQFTGSLNGGVDVTNWIIKYHPEGIVIEEYEQLISYESLPEIEPDERFEPTDPLEEADLLSEVESEEDSAVDSSMLAFSANNIRLSELIKSNAPPPSTGHVSFELTGSRLADSSLSETLTSEPQFVFFSQPIYPVRALRENITGETEIQCLIDTAGRAIRPRLISTSNIEAAFDKSVMAAALLSKFRPGYVGDTKVEAYLNYKVKFHLATRASSRLEAEETDPTAASADTAGDTANAISAGAGLGDTIGTDSISDTASDSVSNTSSDTVSDSTSETTSDTASGDTSLSDTTATETVLSDTTVSDSALADTAAIDTATLDSSLSDSAKTDTVKSDTTASDTALSDTTNAEKAKPDTTKSDTTASGGASSDSAKSG